MRRAYVMLGLGIAIFLAAISLSLLPKDSRISFPQATFLVPAHDGYGFADCLVSGRTCGQTVADTWCEAQGYARAVSFRQVGADEVTGALQQASLVSNPQPVAIDCTN